MNSMKSIPPAIAIRYFKQGAASMLSNSILNGGRDVKIYSVQSESKIELSFPVDINYLPRPD